MADDSQSRVDFAKTNGLAVCAWHENGTLRHIEFAPPEPEGVTPPTAEDAAKRAAAVREHRMQVLRGAAPQLRPGKVLP